MNYLAHFHLSHGDNELLLGALLGDFVKGPLTGAHPKGLEQGIVLHRKIDAFTDSHHGLRQLQQSFDPLYRRYAGIMTDVAFDYFLNKHWLKFHHQSLDIFSQHIYQLLTDNSALTHAAKQQADMLIHYDVLTQYQHWQTVNAALIRIGQRLKRENPLATAASELEQHYPQLEQFFLLFYPQLQLHVKLLRQEF
jgi:acyl carrier protein phosphodiesterase